MVLNWVNHLGIIFAENRFRFGWCLISNEWTLKLETDYKLSIWITHARYTLTHKNRRGVIILIDWRIFLAIWMLNTYNCEHFQPEKDAERMKNKPPQRKYRLFFSRPCFYRFIDFFGLSNICGFSVEDFFSSA